jgi:hypothetical protein
MSISGPDGLHEAQSAAVVVYGVVAVRRRHMACAEENEATTRHGPKKRVARGEREERCRVLPIGAC